MVTALTISPAFCASELLKDKKMNFYSVKNLVWVNPEHTTFDCVVDFEGIGEVPFACHTSDSVEHAIQIWNRAMAGDFGLIAEYVEPEPTAVIPLPDAPDGIPGAVL
jgi:hypothetical protein